MFDRARDAVAAVGAPVVGVTAAISDWLDFISGAMGLLVVTASLVLVVLQIRLVRRKLRSLEALDAENE